MNDNISARFGVSGRFILTIHQADEDGEVIPGTARQVAEFDNLITNTGLDMIGQGLDFNTAAVGTGSTTPANTDTALAAQVSASSTGTGSTLSYNASPEYGQRISVYRFAAGVAAGNLAEVGMKNGTSLFSRALILDGLGSPTTITVLGTEVLDVTYVLRIVPPAADVTGQTVTISGTTYTFTVRPSSVGSWQNVFNWAGTSVSITAYSGAIGTRAAAPASSLGSAISATNSYSNGTKTRTFTGTFGLGVATGSITSFSLNAIGYWQYGFTGSPSSMTKTSSQTLTITFSISWDRA